MNDRPGASISIELTEWQRLGPAEAPSLRGLSLKGDGAAMRLARDLQERIAIREGYAGVEIEATSFVGRVEVGPLCITIRPKIPALPLAALLRYAYGLRDLHTFDETRSSSTRYGMHDLFASLLAAEVEELVSRGLPQRYVPVTGRLESPRGSILIATLAREGGVREARLPCRFSPRRSDWHLNRVLRAGLDRAAALVSDPALRQHLHRLSGSFGDVRPLSRLTPLEVTRAKQDLTRLTSSCEPALTLIGLLCDDQGHDLEDSAARAARIPGFLFDMNMFFQRLLSRFFREHLEGASILDELPIKNIYAYAAGANPRRRRVFAPRPDYALLVGKELRLFLDAKYRDLWHTSLPAGWLYQLSVYALSTPARRSIILYPVLDEAATDQRIEAHMAMAAPRDVSAEVVIRPVPMLRLAEILSGGTRQRKAAVELAAHLVELKAR